MSRQSKQYWSFCEGGWYIPKSNHLLFLKFISTNKPSMSFGKLRFVKSLLGMSLLTYISMPPPFRFRYSRKGKEKPSIRKLDVIKVSSSFVSVSTSISTKTLIISVRDNENNRWKRNEKKKTKLKTKKNKGDKSYSKQVRAKWFVVCLS